MRYTIQHAIEIAKELEPVMANIDMHVAIGGSLAYRGTSEKDIDIYLYPDTRQTVIDRNQIVALLATRGFKSRKANDESRTKVADVFVSEQVTTGNKVDFFFLERHSL